MRVDAFDFELPSDRIATRPVRPRDSARMLEVMPPGDFRDRGVRDLPACLRPGDLLVTNDTKVIPAQLSGRIGEGRVGITLHLRLDANRWWVFGKPGKKLKPGRRIRFAADFAAEVMEQGSGGDVLLRFETDHPEGLDGALQAYGAMPLPPYMKRDADAQDQEDYQTVYADKPGAVAAPTAGLHFTPRLLAAVEEAGIKRATVTLHVGAGTFLPVKVEDTDDHHMHAEWGVISSETAALIQETQARGGRIVAVGTTAMRILESAAARNGAVTAFADTTDLFITPGFRFRAVDLLMTNFHLPRSTLFMLVSAFAGLPTMQAAYAYAVAQGYRFYSYGDSSLLHRREMGA